jgi:hypothetical protein
LEGQRDWQAHADYMDALVAEGFILLGGPLEGTDDVLIIIRASDAREIDARLDEDCWTCHDMQLTTRVVPGTLRLGSLG